MMAAPASKPVAAAPYRIHRYPSQLIDKLLLRDGRAVIVRPVLPQDAEAEQAFIMRLSPQARRLRFHGAVTMLPASLLASMTQIDYRREVALVAEAAEAGVAVEGGAPRLVADARYVCPDDCNEAEFAIAVADDWQGLGLAKALLCRLARHARRSGIRALRGDVLVGNEPMERLLERLGAGLSPDRHDASVHRVRWAL